MKLRKVTSLLKQVMMISREKMKKMTFRDIKTKLRSNTSRKFNDMKLKRMPNKPKKKKGDDNSRRRLCVETIKKI